MKLKKITNIWFWAIAGAILALLAPNLIILLLVVGVVWVCVTYTEDKLQQYKEHSSDDDDDKPTPA